VGERRLERLGYVVTAACVALFGAWAILPSSPISGLGLALLSAAAVAGLLGTVLLVVALESRLGLVFGLSFCVSLAGVIAAGWFNAPAWLSGVALAAMLFVLGGFSCAEALVVAARRFVEKPRGAPGPRSPSRHRLGDVSHQVFFAVFFAATVAVTLGHGGAGDALFAAALGVVLISVLLRLPVGRRGLTQGVAWLVGTAAAIILGYVVRSKAAADAVIAIGVVVAAAVALREARRGYRR
jgi:hypothetical protein